MKNRFFFAWPVIVSTDNIRLKHLLGKGLAENHFHLKGSAPHFSLSWICLMNRFTNRREAFRELERQARLEPEIIEKFTGKTSNLYAQIKKAAYIRAFFFNLLMNGSAEYFLADGEDQWKEKKRRNETEKSVNHLSLLEPGREDELDIYVNRLQAELQKDIRKRGIGIKTNPSSNYLIGSFRKYVKHPLVSFYNLGLTADPAALNSCPQLFVSINTDDQGVFNTYLEKEYALMALALEREEDPEGNKIYNPSMIYDWLDRIRQMGLEQSFK